MMHGQKNIKLCNTIISIYLQTSMTSQKMQYACAVRSLRCFVENNASRYNESSVQEGWDFILHAIDTFSWEWQGKVIKTWKWRYFYTFTQLLKHSLSLPQQISLLNGMLPVARKMDSDSSTARHCAGVLVTWNIHKLNRRKSKLSESSNMYVMK